eukprot:3474315-Prymnesium_polylepis.1
MTAKTGFQVTNSSQSWCMFHAAAAPPWNIRLRAPNLYLIVCLPSSIVIDVARSFAADSDCTGSTENATAHSTD